MIKIHLLERMLIVITVSETEVYKSSLPSGVSDDVRSFGSVSYWMRLRVPMTETIRLYKEKLKAVDFIHGALNQDAQVLELQLPAERKNLRTGVLVKVKGEPGH